MVAARASDYGIVPLKADLGWSYTYIIQAQKPQTPLGKLHMKPLSIDLHALPVRKLTEVCSRYMWLQANVLR